MPRGKINGVIKSEINVNFLLSWGEKRLKNDALKIHFLNVAIVFFQESLLVKVYVSSVFFISFKFLQDLTARKRFSPTNFATD